MGETEDERTAQASQLFENFVQASTCKGTLQAFSILCRQLELDPLDHSNFYSSLKAAVSSWKVKALWTKLDKRAQQKVYNHNKACQGTRCLIIGGGPCGLRIAIELVLLGCKVVVIEKRDTFSRNNVLHLWPYTIHDLRALGAKKFYGKFCAGAIDHISIRQLQLMLLKVSLILGVEIHVNVEFVKLLEPPEQQTEDAPGWRAELRPSSHPVSDFDFDVVIGADGRRSTLDGFSRKEFRGKLAIAITANFVNRNTTAEAKVEEISGVAFIFNQKFFLELKEETERLLNSDNVNQEALLSYAREAADFGTNYQLPSLDYAINHYGQPDVAMFDFTCMYASENAALIREKHGHQLLVALPFWPMGTGCARGFLAAFDTAWMVRGWAQGKNCLETLAERCVTYSLMVSQVWLKKEGCYEDQSTCPEKISFSVHFSDFDSLNGEDVARNNQLAFDVAEQEFGIQPVTTGKEMAARAEPDKLLMVLYLSKFFEAFRNPCQKPYWYACYVCGRLSSHIRVTPEAFLPARTTTDEKKAEDDSVNKRRRKGSSYLTELSCHSAPPIGEDGELRENKVRSMATQLLAKFEENSSTAKMPTKDFPPGLGGSDICHFCSKRVYVMERLSAEGYFFHRECFRCDVCNCTLRLGGHTFDSQEGMSDSL
ncbi:hypothetical protein GOODEAATRI_007520 [Goodea atripinnis]|uniref:LIM zinc-binding domain-containing protein n=1 Tax=Goodea atripinnis TaxID=208336 RepID=A0ABV0N8R1_9TELE